MNSVLRIVLITAGVALFAYSFYYLYTKDQAAPVVFETTEPFVTNIEQKTVATGSILPRKEVEIKPQISGIVQQIFVQAGDSVAEGDLVARIKVIPDIAQVNAAESRVNQAQIRFEAAEEDFKRQQQLFTDEVISQADFTTAEANWRTAQEELDAAKNNLQIIRDGVSQKAGAGTNTLIKSTVAGMVLDVPVKEGNSVIESNTFNDGTTIAVVADMSSMVFEGKVDESEVGKIHEGMELSLDIGAIEDQTFVAVLEYISPKGEEETGTIQFEIRAAVEIPAGSFIRAGYSATADIVLESRDSVLAIQEAHLMFVNDSAFAEVETKPNEFEKRYVETGLSDGINIEVLGGLEKGDKVKQQVTY